VGLSHSVGPFFARRDVFRLVDFFRGLFSVCWPIGVWSGGIGGMVVNVITFFLFLELLFTTAQA
jgi:hypothetical protein